MFCTISTAKANSILAIFFLSKSFIIASNVIFFFHYKLPNLLYFKSKFVEIGEFLKVHEELIVNYNIYSINIGFVISSHVEKKEKRKKNWIYILDCIMY